MRGIQGNEGEGSEAVFSKKIKGLAAFSWCCQSPSYRILSPLCLPFHHPGSEGKSSAERRLIRRSQAVVNMLGTLSPNGSRRYVARRRMYSPQDLPAALQAQTLYENSSIVHLAASARQYLPETFILTASSVAVNTSFRCALPARSLRALPSRVNQNRPCGV